MNYASLEDAYGTPFGQRVPVTHARKDVKEQAPPRTAEKVQEIVQSVAASLPLDTNPTTENFHPVRREVHQRQAVRESFATPPAQMTDEDKLARILRLIEQNRTGYERASTQDMLLYIFTGVVFLFTFDTFVMMGKGMRK